MIFRSQSRIQFEVEDIEDVVVVLAVAKVVVTAGAEVVVFQGEIVQILVGNVQVVVAKAVGEVVIVVVVFQRRLEIGLMMMMILVFS